MSRGAAVLEAPAALPVAAPAVKMEILPPNPQSFPAFAAMIQESVVDVAWHSVHALYKGYEIGKLMVEYAETPELRKIIECIRTERIEQKLGGRPLEGHCYVAGLLQEKIGLSKPWLEKCSRAFLKDRETNFSLGPKLAMWIAKGKAGFKAALNESPLLINSLPNPERLLPAPEGEDADPPMDPKELGREFAQKLFRFMYWKDGKGQTQPRLHTKAHLNAWFREANHQLEALGVPCQLIPKAKN